MKFSKRPLTFDEQADLLIARGMEGDRAQLVQCLASVNYYRLSGYWFARHQADAEGFLPGTRFKVVWNQYVFDRKLRLVLMDAIGRIEIAPRTKVSYHHAREHGPFHYHDVPESLPGLDTDKLQSLTYSIDRELKRSKEVFISHFKGKYGDTHDVPPIWMVTEVLSFGCVLILFKGCSKSVKRSVASAFDVPPKVLECWLWTLNEVRNVVAPHGRL